MSSRRTPKRSRSRLRRAARSSASADGATQSCNARPRTARAPAPAARSSFRARTRASPSSAIRRSLRTTSRRRPRCCKSRTAELVRRNACSRHRHPGRCTRERAKRADFALARETQKRRGEGFQPSGRFAPARPLSRWAAGAVLGSAYSNRSPCLDAAVRDLPSQSSYFDGKRWRRWCCCPCRSRGGSVVSGGRSLLDPSGRWSTRLRDARWSSGADICAEVAETLA